jgi:hypothetical protein
MQFLGAAGVLYRIQCKCALKHQLVTDKQIVLVIKYAVTGFRAQFRLLRAADQMTARLRYVLHFYKTSVQ